MPAWVWVLIVVAAVLVLAVVIWRAMTARRSRHLQDRFGPEYNRTLDSSDSKRDAEAELRAREERREQLDIRPLPTAARDRYVDEWQRVQALFVDDPQGAVHDGDMLIQSVMRDRGYPVDDFEQRSSDISVDHPKVVENYRQGHQLANASARGDGTTEDLRQAMRHYRALFEELVDETADTPLSRDEESDVRADDGTVSRRG
ncbi:MAG TPA: hypothetical protein VHQ89_01530 [Gaiellaceae bacterium]|jgi:hypothetical protein|nr:hypothetical protein [Gaiellaceae bacterium]